VDSFVDEVTNEGFTDAGVHPLVPIKDSLQSLKIHVKQSLECLLTLLNNDGDMLRLLLTEQCQAEPIGVIVSPNTTRTLSSCWERMLVSSTISCLKSTTCSNDYENLQLWHSLIMVTKTLLVE
jgi:hypothetical protein